MIELIPNTEKLIGKILKENKDSIDFDVIKETEHCDKKVINIPNILIHKRRILKEGLVELIVDDWFLEKKLADIS